MTSEDQWVNAPSVECPFCKKGEVNAYGRFMRGDRPFYSWYCPRCRAEFNSDSINVYREKARLSELEELKKDIDLFELS